QAPDGPALAKDQMLPVWIPAGGRRVESLVPYAALVFDAHGGTWVYVDRTAGGAEQHVYERRRVELGPAARGHAPVPPPPPAPAERGGRAWRRRGGRGPFHPRFPQPAGGGPGPRKEGRRPFPPAPAPSPGHPAPHRHAHLPRPSVAAAPPGRRPGRRGPDRRR